MAQSNSEQIILGIDPGTTIMGYGVISVRGSKIQLVNYGVINLTKYKSHELKLKTIFERVTGLINSYTPDHLAIEAPFFGKNVQSMLKLGRAQGVAMAAGLVREIPISEYAPKQIKLAITGSGTASKEQVAGMLKHIFGLKELPQHLDATDGLAAALCHHHALQNKIPAGNKKNNWGAFLKNNPNRLG
ncbi:crossover junction endodeoxyribonuclease RuvC [Luteibaculum oceani]|uniref:Crossover junction endodeoxyribonuclease RuvC n=1 Tax=Luteibaculum oceani TaxID=1294296 RepID=A0A5C6V0F3_9FLAO|nr:crossover junction endodeoxyribonuclease RuvC [Luteibaculum oceani]TXC79007.1 crossover junction endodeoxyribonuclease RuvC [Luteibaculum oceani]